MNKEGESLRILVGSPLSWARYNLNRFFFLLSSSSSPAAFRLIIISKRKNICSCLKLQASIKQAVTMDVVTQRERERGAPEWDGRWRCRWLTEVRIGDGSGSLRWKMEVGAENEVKMKRRRKVLCWEREGESARELEKEMEAGTCEVRAVTRGILRLVFLVG